VEFWTYILKSEVADRYYIGTTEHIEKRLKEHNSRKRGWTNRFRPWKLIYTEAFPSRAGAIQRERKLKSKEGIKEKLEIIKKVSCGEHP
jgi:putative endonuclease